MGMIDQIWMFCGYILFPRYREKIRREWGWWYAEKAGFYLLTKPDCDRNDLDAARILRQCMRELE